MDQHNLSPEHPPFCAPCAVTIYDQDCLMDDGATWVSWTRNLTPERVLLVLERARVAVEREIGRAHHQDTRNTKEHQEGLG